MKTCKPIDWILAIAITAAVATVSIGCTGCTTTTTNGVTTRKLNVAADAPILKAVVQFGVSAGLTASPSIRPDCQQALTDLGIAIRSPAGISAADLNTILTPLPVSAGSSKAAAYAGLADAAFNALISWLGPSILQSSTAADVQTMAVAAYNGLAGALGQPAYAP